MLCLSCHKEDCSVHFCSDTCQQKHKNKSTEKILSEATRIETGPSGDTIVWKNINNEVIALGSTEYKFPLKIKPEDKEGTFYVYLFQGQSFEHKRKIKENASNLKDVGIPIKYTNRKNK